MPQHLSQELAERYRRRTMSKPELIAADQHLASCGECREMLANRQGLNSQIDALRADLNKSLEEDHVDYPQLEAYVDQKLSSAESQALDLHFRSCASCSEELQDLQALKNQLGAQKVSGLAAEPMAADVAPRRLRKMLSFAFPVAWRAAGGWALAACALIALAVAIRLAWEWQQKSKTLVHKLQTIPAPTPEPNTNPPLIVHKPETIPAPTPERSNKAPVIAQKPETMAVPTPKPSSKDLDLRSDFSPHALSESSEVQAIVASVAASEHLQLPRGFTDLAIRRGGDQEASPLLRPVGTVVASTTPVFVWKAIPGAEGNKVQVNDSLQNPVESSPVLTDTSWTSTAMLNRGSTYVWRIAVISGGVEVQESALDVPQGRFQVLDERQNRQLQEFKRDHPQEHFALGILLAHAGVLDEAVEQFRAVPPSDPNYKLAKKFEREAQDLIVRQRVGSAQ